MALGWIAGCATSAGHFGALAAAALSPLIEINENPRTTETMEERIEASRFASSSRAATS
jgi:hypothetical protein